MAPAAWRRFRYITLPLLGSTVRLSVFFAVVGSLQLFDLIMPLTGGGPFNAAQTMVTFLFNFGVLHTGQTPEAHKSAWCFS